jgi:hypothetical protein
MGPTYRRPPSCCPRTTVGTVSGVRLRWFLTMSTVLLATAALTVLAVSAVEGRNDGADQVIAPPASIASTTTAPTDAGEGSVRVTGTLTAAHLERAVLVPREVAVPFTITADRGFGNGGRITGVLVDGAPATIEWDAGRPLVLSSGVALVLDPVALDLVPQGLRLDLAGAAHALVPGRYHLDTPVAVGTSGVASPREVVDFEAIEGSLFEGRGNAATVLPPDAPRRALGPGVVHLEGTLQLTDATGTRAISRLDAAEGPFELTLTPAPDGTWTVEGELGGQLTAA